MSRLSCALIVFVALVTAAGLASASTGSHVRECGSRSVSAGGVSYDIPGMVTSGVGCYRAFKIALAWLRAVDASRPNARPQGFRCRRLDDGSGGECRKGRRWLSWSTH